MQPLVRAAASLYLQGKFLCLVAGRFACGGEGDMVDVEVATGLVELGQDALADLTRLVDRAFGQENDYLTEFPVRSLRNQKGY